jgi:2-octaprenyl-6-methoxyphenol hydroxylase
VCEHRLVHLGNAAQTLHPVAGQGFNLGMRDCVALVDCLAEVMKQMPIDRGNADERNAAMSTRTPVGAGSSLWKHGDPLLALDKYQRRRRLDRRIVPGLTAALPLVFGSRLPPLAAARSAGLLALDALPAVRRGFTRLLMFGA